MVLDAIYKMTRKALPLSMYKAVSKSIFGRQTKWNRIETYALTFDFYQKQKHDFRRKQIIEVGCGDQYYTAFFFLAAGAEKVLLIEPGFEPDTEKLARELKRFNDHTSGNLAIEDVSDRILKFRDLSEVPLEFDSSLDLCYSYLVLEHFKQIESFFLHVRRILKPNGISCNLVDLSDHTYHIFSKYAFMEPFNRGKALYHLRYSEFLFRILNDSKCFMNRKLLPEYLALAEKHCFKILDLSQTKDPGAIIHRDLMLKYSSANPEDLKTISFLLSMEKTA